MFILTFVWTVLILSRGKARRIIDGFNPDTNWDPFLYVPKDLDDSPNYDITRWVRQLHLQQCAFVEIGEGFCALFVELRSIPSVSKVLDNSAAGEFFLGTCPCLTLHSWDLCPAELTRQRKAECTFLEATPYSNTSARVHRRLCDVTLLSENAPNCNCSGPFAGQGLYKTKGRARSPVTIGDIYGRRFPTCFLNPLPESLCSPRGVCGIAQCSATTIKGIHSPQCASNCHQRQPFCEEIGPWSSIPTEINSLWSRWSSPKCNNSCGSGFMVAVASCQDQREVSDRLHRARIILVRLFGEVCLSPLSMTKGVNFSSCPDTFGKCYCEVNTVDGIMRAARFTEPCISTEGCISGDSETFTFEGEPDPGNSADLNEVYEDDDRERFEDGLPRPQSLRSSRRRLLQAYNRESYDSRESGLGNRLEGGRRYRSVPRTRADDDADYDDEEEEEDDEEESDERNLGASKEAEDDEEEDDEDEEDEETVNDSDQGRSYDYEFGGSASAEVEITFAMKLLALNILLRFLGC